MQPAPSEAVTRLRVVDSHTEGEPTRVVVEGWPPLAGANVAACRDDSRSRFDGLRTGLLCEPRGHAGWVGAVLLAPRAPHAPPGVFFCNAFGYLEMCGHGLIGVVRTLAFLGRLEAGRTSFETPAGVVEAELEAGGSIAFDNVPCRCSALDVEVDVPGVGRVTGDVAWGGNWFFLAQLPALELRLENLAELLRITRAIRVALHERGITGEGAPIDHVELFAPPRRADADACNFVLCPGDAYDRSPCGTGTSAKLAVLHRRGRLRIGQRWGQEGIAGGLFEGRLRARDDGALVPQIRGRAHVTAESVLHFAPADPFRFGL
jgi:4-hydroxyproline epimerase